MTLDEAMIVSEDRMGDMVALDEALNRLAAFDQRKSKIAVMRFFSGLIIDESAEVHHSSLITHHSSLFDRIS